MATLEVSTPQQWIDAVKAATSADTIKLKASVQCLSGQNLRDHVTVDLNGFEQTFQGSDKHCVYIGKGSTYKNGTLRGSQLHPWGIWNNYGGDGFTMQDLYLKDHAIAVKINGAPGSPASNVLFERVDVDIKPWFALTAVDFGPIVTNCTMRDVRVYRPDDGSNSTSADGIAWELVRGTFLLERVKVIGAAGDGIDIKNECDITLLDVMVDGATRNGLKTWGMGKSADGTLGSTTTATLRRVWIRRTGLEGIVLVAGDFDCEDCTFEGYNSKAMNIGGGDEQQDPPRYGWGRTYAVIKDSIIQRWESANPGSLVGLNGDDGNLVTRDAEFRFDNCDFFNSNHPNIVTASINSKPNGSFPGMIVPNAIANKWHAWFTNCRYGQKTAPVVAVAEPNLPGTTEANSPPIPGDITVANVSAGSISLSVTQGSDAVPGGINHITFKVFTSEANRNADTNAIQASNISPGTTQAIPGLLPKTTYYIRVWWYDNTLPTALSSYKDVTVTTKDAPDVVLPTIGYVELRDVTPFNMTLRIGPGEDNQGVTNRYIKIYGSNANRLAGTNALKSQDPASPDTDYTFTGLTPATTYYIRCAWSDANANVAYHDVDINTETYTKTDPSCDLPDEFTVLVGQPLSGRVTINYADWEYENLTIYPEYFETETPQNGQGVEWHEVGPGVFTYYIKPSRVGEFTLFIHIEDTVEGSIQDSTCVVPVHVIDYATGMKALSEFRKGSVTLLSRSGQSVRPISDPPT